MTHPTLSVFHVVMLRHAAVFRMRIVSDISQDQSSLFQFYSVPLTDKPHGANEQNMI